MHPPRRGVEYTLKPVFIFGLYTVFVWWLAFGWRRRVVGFLAVFAGVFGLLTVKALIKLIPDPDGRPFPLVDVLLYPYMGLLLFGGLYILILPRPKKPMTCRRCSYDLAGHTAGAQCPECGTESAAVPARRVVRPTPRRVAGRPSAAYPSAAYQAVRPAQHEHAQGQPGDEQPPQPVAG